MPESLVTRKEPGIALDFRVDQVWMVEEHGAKLLETSTHADETDGSLSVQFRHGVHMREPTLLIPRRWRTSVLPPMTPPQDPYEFELISTYTLFPNERRVERSATLNRNLQRDIMTPSFRRFEGFLFVVPGAAVGDTADCVVDVPGPVYTYNHIEPRTPYPSLAATFVECRLETGRTHQIRIHMCESGHSVCGERVYLQARRSNASQSRRGGAVDESRALRVMLHAAELGFVHPVTGDPLTFTSPLPADMRRVLAELRKRFP